MKIRTQPTTRAIWNALAQEFERKSRMVSVDLRRRLQEQRCSERDDVRVHFAKLRTMREDLAAMGQSPSDDDFFAIIMGSMPSSYEPYLSAISATSRVTGSVLSPDELMEALTEEYERRTLRMKSAKRNDPADVAMSASDQNNSKRKSKKNVECYNCKKHRHYKSECWAPGGGKEGEGPKGKAKAKETAAAATEKKDEAWYTSGADEDGAPAMLAQDPVPADEVIVFDSGATRHMSCYRERFIRYEEISPRLIQAADNHTFKAVGKGDMYVHLPNGTENTTRVLLQDVLHAPSMGVTLISIARVTAAGASVVFKNSECCILRSDGTCIAIIPLINGLYRLHISHSETAAAAVDSAKGITRAVTRTELHRELGHIAPEAAREMVTKGHVEGLVLSELDGPVADCESCAAGKMTRKPIAAERVRPRATEVGGEVHADVWGPSPVETLGRRRYYILYTDDYSRYCSLYLMRTKDEAIETYRKVRAFYSTQKGARICCLHSDRGGEFLSTEFSKLLAEDGTIRKFTAHDTPEYNGVAERGNRTVMERVRAMLHDARLPQMLWGEAALHAVYLKNRTATRSLEGRTPYEAFWGKKPNLAHLHVWGCRVWVHSPGGSKLSPRADDARWVGFDTESDAHRIYWPKRRSVTVERSIFFPETDSDVEVRLEGENEGVSTHLDERVTSPSLSNSSVRPIPPEISDPPTPIVEERAPEPVGRATSQGEVRQSTRVRKESAYVRRLKAGEGTVSGRTGGPVLPRGLQEGTARIEEVNEDEQVEIVAMVQETEEDVVELAMAAAMGDAECVEPSYAEAKKRPDWPKWQEAIKAELDSLVANGTWRIVPRPSSGNVVDSKWVLRVKKNAAGEIDKYKARLVARGFTQVYGVDYYDTFAPVAKLSSIRLLLAIAARNGWAADSFDFNSAYLNSKLDEDVYLEQPPDHAFADRKAFVLKLEKALYGLKQGGRKWYETLCAALGRLGFTRVEADWGVFYKHEGEHLIVLAVHVDDCLLTGSSRRLLDDTKSKIGTVYKITDLGPVSWLLGIKISCDLEAGTLSLSQHAYIEALLARFNFTDLKPVSMPMDPHQLLSKTQCPESPAEVARMRRVPYREAIGALMYAALGTRPDIAFAVSTLAQFAQNPGQPHWDAVKRIFRYLLGTRTLSLIYGGQQRELEGYVNADGATQEHRRAITGYVFLVDGGAVSWASKKQELVTLSTAESEYVAATHAAKEAIWLRRLIGEVFGPLSNATMLYSDNQAAIALTKDGSYHARTKHIDVRYHFIRYYIDAGSIRLLYCPSNDMTADVLTKALPSFKVKHFAAALGLAQA
ncbi:hypothetical protein BN946_scf184644.g9 [Trametes cinnabarina]|uniref:Integrase catalytic domain-containing protein n=1 Tax=Pycnoporus cinnabarinus TaxID=5643 RepID=A0A060SPD4_PYCCI|nr:hypothetical protein BN946_scf184644.g9 [Trametes cinnabarina]